MPPEPDSRERNLLLDGVVSVLLTLVGALIGAAFVYQRRGGERSDALTPIAAALGLRAIPKDEAVLAQAISGLRRSYDDARAQTAAEEEREVEAELPAPPAVSEPAGDAPRAASSPQARREMLSQMAQFWVEALAESARDLEGDAEFAGYYRRLGLGQGAERAAKALEACRAGNPGGYEAAMFDALSRGEFDAVLTSLDVLSAYARPESDWRSFLVGLEAAEALLTLALLDCGVRLSRPALMTPVDPAALGDVSLADDRRKLRELRSATKSALAASAGLASSALALVFDCYSPGWRSDAFGSRDAWATLFDPASMTGDAP